MRCVVFFFGQKGATDVLGMSLEEGGAANTVDSFNVGELTFLFCMLILDLFWCSGRRSSTKLLQVRGNTRLRRFCVALPQLIKFYKHTHPLELKIG